MSPVSPNNKELALRPTNNWKKSLSLGNRINSRSTKNQHTGEIRGWWEDPDDPVHVLYACAGGWYGGNLHTGRVYVGSVKMRGHFDKGFEWIERCACPDGADNVTTTVRFRRVYRDITRRHLWRQSA